MASTRKVIAVFHKETGIIKQVIACHERDLAANVGLHADHRHLDITDHPLVGQIKLNTHAVHPERLEIIERVPLLEEVRFHKRREVNHSWERAVRRAMYGTGDFQAERAAANEKRADLERQIDSAQDVETLAKITWGE